MRTSSRTPARRRRPTRSPSWPRRGGARSSGTACGSSTRSSWSARSACRRSTGRSRRGGGEASAVAAKARARRPAARAEAIAAPRMQRRPGGDVRLLARVAPSRRSLAAGLGILLLALAGYALARETSLFAIRRVEVSGGSPRVDAEVQDALGQLRGTSLVGLDGADVIRRVD